MANGEQNRRSDDPAARARAQTVTLAKRRLKRYGLLTLWNIAAFIFISHGMPGYALWPILSIPLCVSFLCLLFPTLSYGGILVAEWLDMKSGE